MAQCLLTDIHITSYRQYWKTEDRELLRLIYNIQCSYNGVLSLEKGTNCGLTATELQPSQAKFAKKEGLSSHVNVNRELSNLFI